MFLFQTSSSITVPKISQKDVTDCISAQKSLMLRFPSGKTSMQDIIISIGNVYNACVDINKNSDMPPELKKDFFSFVDVWKAWADKAAKANGSLTDNDKKGLAGLLTDISAAYKVPDLDLAKRLFYSNFVSILSMYEDYSGGNPLSQKQADLVASFLTKMADKSVVNYYQCRLLVEAMMEVVSGNAPDRWPLTFPDKGAAGEFVENVLGKGLPPGFKAQNIIASGTLVSFSLVQTDATDNEINKFLTAAPAEPAEEKKQSPKKNVQDDGGLRMASFRKISIIKEDKPAGYTVVKQSALDATADQPSSYMEKTMSQNVSSSLYYGEKYESDQYLSKGIAKDQVKTMIYDLAKRFGYTIPPATLKEWLVSKEPGKGQKFLQKLKAAGIKLNVTGSADMEVFFDGENENAWAAAADKNLALAKQRSSLVIAWLKEFNTDISKVDAGNIGFDFSDKPQGRLHFFQDFTDDEAKQLGLAGYGYKGDGAANMSALMAYLKAVKDATSISPSGVAASYSFKVGETTLYFTQKDKDDAAKHYDKLISSGAVVLSGQAYKADDASLLNKYFRRMTGDPSLNGAPGASEGMISEGKIPNKEGDNYVKPNVFSRAKTESTVVSGRSVSLVYVVTARLGISTEVTKENGKDVVRATAKYTVNGVAVPFNAQNAIETETAASGRTVAVAYTNDGSINSGYAWRTLAEKPKIVETWLPQVEETGTRALAGTSKNIRFSALRSVTAGAESRVESTDVRIAFGIAKSRGSPITYFECPGKVSVSKEVVYSVAEKDIIVDRGLKTDLGVVYSKEDLIKMASFGVVAIKVSTGDFENSPAWFCLDGKTRLKEDEMDDLSEGDDGFLHTTSRPKTEKRFVLSTSSEQNEIRSSMTGPESNAQRALIPNSILLPKDKLVLGDKTYSAAKLRNLAKEHIIAIVANKETPDGPVATFYRIDGQEIGPRFKLDGEGMPELPGLFIRKEKQKGDFDVDTYRPNLPEIYVRPFIYSEQAYGKITRSQ
ncbi:MAG: hypothetical protein NTX79_01460 [Candidatus Micrarchaeota archaeon]|nr:hypothetical protein [Candidatus Micrarchaeota archaeon]